MQPLVLAKMNHFKKPGIVTILVKKNFSNSGLYHHLPIQLKKKLVAKIKQKGAEKKWLGGGDDKLRVLDIQSFWKQFLSVQELGIIEGR